MKEEILRYALEHWGIDLTHVLDMGCGAGIMTKLLLKCGASSVDSSDPAEYAATRFAESFGRPCLRYGFEDIAAGSFPRRRYTLVVCSYSLHFMKTPVAAFMSGLRGLTSTLLVIGPGDSPAVETPHWYAAHEYQTRNQAKGRLFRVKSLML